jgi:hypothetical protein
LSLLSAGTDSEIPRPSGEMVGFSYLLTRTGRGRRRERNCYLASLFDTLLSSQGSSAH